MPRQRRDDRDVPTGPGVPADSGRLAELAQQVDMPAGVLAALRSDPASSLRTDAVARARRRVVRARLDDENLLEGIASSLLAASNDL